MQDACTPLMLHNMRRFFVAITNEKLASIYPGDILLATLLAALKLCYQMRANSDEQHYPWILSQFMGVKKMGLDAPMNSSSVHKSLRRKGQTRSTVAIGMTVADENVADVQEKFFCKAFRWWTEAEDGSEARGT